MSTIITEWVTPLVASTSLFVGIWNRISNRRNDGRVRRVEADRILDQVWSLLAANRTSGIVEGAFVSDIATTFTADAGDQGQADRLLRDAENLCPGYIRVQEYRANWHCATGSFDKGIEVYERIIEKKPKEAKHYNNLGRILFAAGECTRALGMFDNAIRVCPDAFYYSNKAGALLELGRHKEAEAACKRALSLDHTCAFAYRRLGRTLLEQEQWTEALEAYGRAVSLKPDHAQAHEEHAQVLVRLGRYQDALGAINRAIRLDSTDQRRRMRSKLRSRMGKVRAG